MCPVHGLQLHLGGRGRVLGWKGKENVNGDETVYKSAVVAIQSRLCRFLRGAQES